MASRLEELSKEEGIELTKALQEVLETFNCELGVVSNIQLLKRVEDKEPILSPIQPNDGNSEETKTD